MNERKTRTFRRAFKAFAAFSRVSLFPIDFRTCSKALLKFREKICGVGAKFSQFSEKSLIATHTKLLIERKHAWSWRSREWNENLSNYLKAFKELSIVTPSIGSFKGLRWNILKLSNWKNWILKRMWRTKQTVPRAIEVAQFMSPIFMYLSQC